MSKICGEDISSLVGRESPFGEVVFIGYDDGPTLGALRCAAGAETYRFDMLDRDYDGSYDFRAWDRGEEIRIFSLGRLPTAAGERFAVLLARDEVREKLAEDAVYYREVAAILDAAEAPHVVIATHGIQSAIIAVRAVGPGDLHEGQDWFSFLGFARANQRE